MIIIDNVSVSIIVACLFLMHQYMTDADGMSNKNELSHNYNPNRTRSRVERFGNSHEYEIMPHSKKMNNATSKGAWQNFQERQRKARGEQLFLRSTRDQTGIDPKVYEDNNLVNMVDDVLYPRNATVDDRMSQFTSHNERKSKKSLEYRSAHTKDNLERFLANELDTHEHREWWYDPRDEYGDKHVIF